MTDKIVYGSEEDKAIIAKDFLDAVKREKSKRLAVKLNANSYLEQIDTFEMYSFGSKIYSFFDGIDANESVVITKAVGLKIDDNNIYDFRGVAYNKEEVLKDIFSPNNIKEMVCEFMQTDYRFGGLIASQYRHNLDNLFQAGEVLCLNYFACNPHLEVSAESLKGIGPWQMLNELKRDAGHMLTVDVPARYKRPLDEEDFAPDLFFLTYTYENDFGVIHTKRVGVADCGVEMKAVMNNPEVVKSIKAKLAENYHPQDYVIETEYKPTQTPKSRPRI